LDQTNIRHILDSPLPSFEEKALALYGYQYEFNPIYRQFVNIVKYNDYHPQNVSEIPFLPISLFKSRLISTGVWSPETAFYSSGTTGSVRSQHQIRSLPGYLSNTRLIWEETFGSLEDYRFVSLLPSYHDNPSSSLIHMVHYFMKCGSGRAEAYYLNHTEELHKLIEETRGSSDRVVLFGVSFALMDYVDQYQHGDCSHIIVVETGGMKKRGREITRTALHGILRSGFSKASIVSEYGMTECLSQLYCLNSRSFHSNSKMDYLIGDPTDPAKVLDTGSRGRILLIDLANVDSVAFISTDEPGGSGAYRQQ